MAFLHRVTWVVTSRTSSGNRGPRARDRVFGACTSRAVRFYRCAGGAVWRSSVSLQPNHSSLRPFAAFAARRFRLFRFAPRAGGGKSAGRGGPALPFLRETPPRTPRLGVSLQAQIPFAFLCDLGGFAVQFLPIRISRRWRQVGRPRRASPTRRAASGKLANQVRERSLREEMQQVCKALWVGPLSETIQPQELRAGAGRGLRRALAGGGTRCPPGRTGTGCSSHGNCARVVGGACSGVKRGPAVFCHFPGADCFTHSAKDCGVMPLW